jgi:hypothetical protein
MADLCLVFKEASILFSRVVVLACIPTSSGISPKSSPTFDVGGVFDDSYSNRGEVES